MKITLFAYSAAFLLGACDHSEKPPFQQNKSDPASNKNGTDEFEAESVGSLRSKLKGVNGGGPFIALIHKGEEGFQALADAFAAGEVTLDDYTGWDYDLKTRWPDGAKLSEDFENYLYGRVEKQEEFAENLGAKFYSQFPRVVLEELKKDPRPGAKKVAFFAIRKQVPPTSPAR